MMKTAKAALAASMGCWMILPALAQQIDSPVSDKSSDASFHFADGRTPLPDRVISRRYAQNGNFYTPAGKHGALFGYAGTPDGTAFIRDSSHLHLLSAMGDLQLNVHDWLTAIENDRRIFIFGYAWHDIKFEGSASTLSAAEKNALIVEPPRLDASSGTLSYSPTANWTVQFTRRHLSGLDQLEPNEDIRRTALAAKYSRVLSAATWETTLAWGRNVRRSREPTMGYLLESTFRVRGTHTFFGRVEQVGSDSLMREDVSSQRQVFKMNKLTIGYFFDALSHSRSGVDVGAFISKYRVPSAMSPSYGSDPVIYMMFMRLKLQ